ncbi:unnamed protein product [Bursaphelenchus xylophilus]|uniref:(pine wood nematode) hypothetical protein n=1 Tax=Bursaphelenchus xylophilus TaxID=6326 RepID=A0A1I7RKB8_BURXY|nr:unnamed protein product [Bursaphelenchus xylophilus]CAG9131389.1 unnamed protein product [Bursaphelenchus xylophilus]
MLMFKIVLVVTLLSNVITTSTYACAATAPPSQPTTIPATTSTTTTSTGTTECGTSCSQVTLKMDSENSRPINQTAKENAGNGCPGFVLDCGGTSDDSAVIFTWYRSGTDVGSTFGTGTVTATVICSANNQLTLEGSVVDSVECIST